MKEYYAVVKDYISNYTNVNWKCGREEKPKEKRMRPHGIYAKCDATMGRRRRENRIIAIKMARIIHAN